MSEVAVLGAGPAGLTSAYVLAREGRSVTVFEQAPVVGGLARTEVRDGWRFDLGGHRFYTRSREVEVIWKEILGDELLLRDRLSRIYFQGKFIDYPLSAGELIRKLGPVELFRSGLSYLAAQMRASRNDETFEDWVVSRFGRRLFDNFFRSYTEKVWGVPCNELSADWAAQRIRELSFSKAVRDSIGRSESGEVTSLIRQFLYPRLGPGQMWEEMARRIEESGGSVRLSTPVRSLRVQGGRVRSVETDDGEHEAEHFISSLPLSRLPELAGAPQPEIEAAAGLRHRDFLTVALAVDGEDPFPDNWIYVHDPSVEVARIQNYRSWSPDMVPESGASSLGLEYFCFRNDPLWITPDEELIELATAELEQIGLVSRADVRQGWVVRVPMAYPIYDDGYRGRVERINGWLDSIGNLQQIGRNGLHRYNNSDHSMLTGMVAAANIDGAGLDIREVNAEPWYGEAGARAVESPYLRRESAAK